MHKQEQQHPCDSYTKLKHRFRDIGRLEAIAEVLGRDFLTGMPDGAYRSRRNQIAYLYRLAHEMTVAPEIRDLLTGAQNHAHTCKDAWDQWDHANLREMALLYTERELLDGETVSKLAEAEQEGRRFHSEALANDDWDTAARQLQRVVDLQRKVGEIRAKAFNLSSPYEAMLNVYAPGFSLAEVDAWFSVLKQGLDDLLPQAREKQADQNPPVPLKGRFPASCQMWLNRELLKLIGFDFERGGLYETGHNPVEGGTPDDTRLVIKNVDERDFTDSLKSTLHEGGHGLYIQGLPKSEWRYQPVANDLGAAVHESQALMVEMVVARTPGFFDYIAPRIEGLFQDMSDKALSAENLHKLKTWVEPGADRKKADELTYFYHILMRFEIERDLIAGRLPIDKIPRVWAEKMEAYLGIVPQNISQGPLQDVHWFVGKFGYFPAYTIGHMIAAQLFDKMMQDMPQTCQKIHEGDFLGITKWLNEKIHACGRLYEPQDLIKEATGKSLSPDALVNHLRSRYL